MLSSITKGPPLACCRESSSRDSKALFISQPVPQTVTISSQLSQSSNTTEQWPQLPSISTIASTVKWTLTNRQVETNPYLAEGVFMPTAPVVGLTSSPPLLSTQSCPVFNPLHSPQPSGVMDESLQAALTLDDSLLELCLKSVMVTDSTSQESTQPNGLMDNLLTDSFTDISTLMDSSMLNLLPQEDDEVTFEFSEDALGLSSPSIAMSSMPTPTSRPPSVVSSPPTSVVPSPPVSDIPESVPSYPDTPTLENRKRKSSVDEDNDETMPPTKISCQDKEAEKRRKNNVASQASRAKRRTKVKASSPGRRNWKCRTQS